MIRKLFIGGFLLYNLFKKTSSVVDENISYRFADFKLGKVGVKTANFDILKGNFDILPKANISFNIYISNRNPVGVTLQKIQASLSLPNVVTIGAVKLANPQGIPIRAETTTKVPITVALDVKAIVRFLGSNILKLESFINLLDTNRPTVKGMMTINGVDIPVNKKIV